MKKILLIVVLLFLTTGCKVHYEVELKDGIVTESSYITIDNNNLISGSVYDAVDQIIMKYDPIHDWLVTYETEEIFGKDDSTLRVTGMYKMEDYGNSMPLNLCYDNYNVSLNDNYYEISTPKGAVCFDNYEEIEEIKISFKTNHKVYSHNADKVKNGVYTWNITEDNKESKSIYLKTSKVAVDEVNNSWVYLVLIAIFIIIVGLLSWVKKKQVENNRI